MSNLHVRRFKGDPQFVDTLSDVIDGFALHPSQSNSDKLKNIDLLIELFKTDPTKVLEILNECRDDLHKVVTHEETYSIARSQVPYFIMVSGKYL